MTCRHVLGLIDAGPFADYPRAHLDAAWQHARQCPTCGPALAAGAALAADLATLPYPAPPPTLAATVRARIALNEAGRPADARTATTGATSPSAPRAVGSTTSAWPAWATALGGLGAGITAVLTTPLDRAAAVDVPWFSPPWLTAGFAAMPPSNLLALVLVGGLGLYMAGLFGQLRRRRR